MTESYYADDSVTLYHGHDLDVLRTLPDGSVDCVVTSPPYFGLRDYGQDGQRGLESSPAEYVAGLVAVFAEIRRVLADDGTVWLNLGDSYAGSWGAQSKSVENAGMHTRVLDAQGYAGQSSPSSVGEPGMTSDQNPSDSSLSAQLPQYPSQPSPNSENSSPQSRQIATPSSVGPLAEMRQGARNGNRRSRPRGYEGVPAKNMLGVPWRVAFALQDDGWTLRNDIIWSKPNAMPESVTDRLSTRHEHVFLLTKSRRYWFDLDAVREPAGDYNGKTWEQRKDAGEPSRYGLGGMKSVGATVLAANPQGRNPGDVWEVSTQGFPAAHFAVMPLALAERCILAGCKPGGTVLDPYSGSGTTGLAATKHGRRYIGIDLSTDYLDLSLRTRLRQGVLEVSDASP